MKSKNVEFKKKPNQKAFLILSDGSVFEGKNMGASGTTVGEVVFTTGMVGYQETLTDPSYYGQMVAQTFPLIGNYGLNPEDYESEKPWVKGYIVREWCQEPSNFRSAWNLDEFLYQHEIVGIHDIDTRALTRKIREAGVMNGAITTSYPENMADFLEEIKEYTISQAVKAVSTKENKTFQIENSTYHVALYDYGYRASIVKKLMELGCRVTVLPYNTSLAQIDEIKADGIVLSNGPGNPSENIEAINILKDFIATDLPIMGIGLGHQLLALANGGKTEKLKYGHRGSNQPIKDKKENKVFVSRQNHGYTVIGESIDEKVGLISHYNSNDGSCEGIEYASGNAFGLQYQPEDEFDLFIQLMSKKI